MLSDYRNSMTTGKFIWFSIIFTSDLNLSNISRRYDNTSAMFLIATPSEYRSSTTDIVQPAIKTYSSEISKTHCLETDRRYTNEHRQAILKDVVDMEVELPITTRWQPSSAEYINTVKYLGQHKYEMALDHLQKLVVQQLFELHRMNQSWNGMSMSQCLDNLFYQI